MLTYYASSERLNTGCDHSILHQQTAINAQLCTIYCAVMILRGFYKEITLKTQEEMEDRSGLNLNN